jgi:biotin carboxyl carrier protein
VSSPDDPAPDLAASVEQDVRAVLKALRGSSVEELRLTWPSGRITLRRDLDSLAVSAPPASESGPATPAEPPEPETIEVRAHMVGPFHRSREPDGPALCDVGDTVAAGEAVGVIETLGMAADVEAPGPGRLDRFLAEDGQAVEFGQVLAIIVPQEEG